jgi:hypothetical protein
MTSVIHLAHAGSLRRRFSVALAVGIAAAAMALLGGIARSPASAAVAVNLGTAAPFAVLAGTPNVSNTSNTIISGDLGIYPASAVTGFPPGLVENGTIFAGDAVAHGAQSDLTAAYLDAKGQPPSNANNYAQLGGLTLVPGVYNATSTMNLTGTVTLNAQDNPNAVFIFQAGESLVTATSSSVVLINEANPCNVFWQVTSSATLNGTTFQGSVLALTSATLGSGVTVDGRVLARNGLVSLIDDTISVPICTATPPPPPPPPVTTPPVTTPPVTTPPVTTPPVTTPPVTTPPVTTPLPPTISPSGEVIPVGAPETGAGGAARSGDNVLLVALGGAALFGAIAATGLAIRRRRVLFTRDGRGDSGLGEDE